MLGNVENRESEAWFFPHSRLQSRFLIQVIERPVRGESIGIVRTLQGVLENLGICTLPRVGRVGRAMGSEL